MANFRNQGNGNSSQGKKKPETAQANRKTNGAKNSYASSSKSPVSPGKTAK